jgi:fatty acid desaturase
MMDRSITGSPFRQKFYRFYLRELVLLFGIVWVFVWINPIKAFFYFGIIYALVYVASRYVDYVTHASSHGDSKYSIANVCLHPKFNKNFWNFGFHVAHHLQPRAHWTALPLIYEKLAIDKEPSAVATRPNILGAFTPATFSWHRVRNSGANQ